MIVLASRCIPSLYSLSKNRNERIHIRGHIGLWTGRDGQMQISLLDLYRHIGSMLSISSDVYDRIVICAGSKQSVSLVKTSKSMAIDKLVEMNLLDMGIIVKNVTWNPDFNVLSNINIIGRYPVFGTPDKFYWALNKAHDASKDKDVKLFMSRVQLSGGDMQLIDDYDDVMRFAEDDEISIKFGDSMIDYFFGYSNFFGFRDRIPLGISGNWTSDKYFFMGEKSRSGEFDDIVYDMKAISLEEFIPFTDWKFHVRSEKRKIVKMCGCCDESYNANMFALKSYTFSTRDPENVALTNKNNGEMKMLFECITSGINILMMIESNNADDVELKIDEEDKRDEEELKRWMEEPAVRRMMADISDDDTDDDDDDDDV